MSNSYGFRPGRSAHDAVKAAQAFVRSGKGWVVDIDLSAFFDHVNHDLLFERLKPHIADKRVLALIGRYLRAPMVLGDERQKRQQGTPQGGPLSPVLANIYRMCWIGNWSDEGSAFAAMPMISISSLAANAVPKGCSIP
ncbi:MAG: reverse transcriptase domain-containing protein [Geminicoccaceae bacterium]